MKKTKLSTLNFFTVLMLVAVLASTLFIIQYKPAPKVKQPTISLEQKMSYLESGTPLPAQTAKPVVPRWMLVLIFGFIVVQIFPLALAANKARLPNLSKRDMRQIEFLTETPMFLGLLGSLLGVTLSQFISGTLAAPLAYLTTISGISLYLLGRFTILLSLPSSADNIME